MCSSDIFLGLIAILFPPIAVWIKRGICSADSLINLALCCLGFFPGLLHAWYIIAAYPETDYDSIPQDQDAESGTVTYYYVNQQGGGAGAQQQQQRGYGTNDSMQGQQVGGGGQNKPLQQHPQQQNYLPSAGPSAGVPPSYEQAVRGDNKVQSQE
ncbi:MAG: hypothetical protein M1812_000713 [Candelaria pacifica]|nr:MAG: hypothetical protein M1812_000713 [Candelaria pacifica]